MTDNDAADLAAWIIARSADPDPRLSEFTVDVLTQPALAASVMALEISSMVQVTGLPASAPWTSTTVFVEGYTETVSATGWSITFTCSPATTSRVGSSARPASQSSTARPDSDSGGPSWTVLHGIADSRRPGMSPRAGRRVGHSSTVDRPPPVQPGCGNRRPGHTGSR